MSSKNYETSGYGHDLDIANHLALIVYFISYEEWMQRKKIHLRHVGFIWFIFNVLQLLPIRFTQQNSCCISKSMMKHLQKLGLKIRPPLI